MGYYTDYSLIVEDGFVDQEEFNQVRDSITDYPIDFQDEQNFKWYDHEKDMKEISKSFPGVLFRLDGYGEEKEDIWQKYFKEGKMQVCRAEIKFADFDESLLKL